MGRRGPKPVDVGLLEMYANDWSLFLYMLRDGREAQLYKVTHSERVENQGGRTVRIPVTNQLFVARFEPASNDARLLLKNSPPNPPGGEWLVTPPMLPAPEIWNRFKDADSTAKMEKVLTVMEKRASEEDRGVLAPLFKAARQHCADIVRAKELPHYPGSGRPGSDNKRIDFFAKVLAGFALDLAPLTATKRLSGWLPTIPMHSARLARERIEG